MAICVEHRRALRSGVALACSLVGFLVTNGSIYPAIALVSPLIREAATVVGIMAVGLIAFTSYRIPRLLRPRILDGLTALFLIAYFACDTMGLSLRNGVLMLVGSVADSLAEAWLFVVAYGAFTQVSERLRPITALLSCLVAFLLQPFAEALEPICAVGVNVACFVCLALCARPLVDDAFAKVAESDPQAEMAVANPLSFLPANHLLFIAVFVFSVAQGLSLALPGPFNEAPALPLSFVPLVVVLVVYGVRGMPSADGLFSFCALLIIAGMFLQPSDRLVSQSFASLSNTFIDAGASCFNLVIIQLVGGIVARNRLTVVTAPAMILCLCWFGILVGAVTGNGAMMVLGWTESALVWLSWLAAMSFIVFCFVTLKGFSFSDTVSKIQVPLLAEAPEAAAATLEERCAAVSAEYGLTPRESEVFVLLAQGRTVGVIREKLVISLNTARFHTKNIYVKLGVHSQQELIDLVESFEV